MQAIQKRLNALPDRNVGFQLTRIFERLFRNQSMVVGSITSGAGATLATAANIAAFIDGQLVTKASGSAITMTGATVPNSGTANQAWLLCIDTAANLVALPGVQAASLGAVQLPIVPELNPASPYMPLVVVGLITLVNGSAGNYVPGTTATNTASLTWAFYPITGPFWPVQVL